MCEEVKIPSLTVSVKIAGSTSALQLVQLHRIKQQMETKSLNYTIFVYKREERSAPW